MIILLYFTLYAFLVRRRRSIALLLSVMLAVSAFAGVLIGVTAPVDNPEDILNIFYTLLVLTIFISPFRRYAGVRKIVPANGVKLARLTAVLVVVGAATFAINGYVFYRVITSGIDYELFKNSPVGTEFRYSLPISHSLISLASFLSAVAYPLLALGFFYAYRKKAKLSALCFFLSLNMPLQGFTMLSRSWAVMYLYLLLAYSVYSLYIYNKKFRRRLLLGAAVVTLPVAVYLVNVTQNRFREFEVDNPSAVSDPQVYSLLSYYSQWNANGIIVMSRFYSNEAIQYGGSTNTLIPYVYDLVSRFVFGVDHRRENEMQMRARIWPDPYSWMFNGLVANLVFDFGYILTVVFALAYAGVTRSLAPSAGTTSLFAYLNFGLVVTVPIFSMFGNYFAVLFYNLGIVYSLVIGCYLMFRLRPARARSSAGGAAASRRPRLSEEHAGPRLGDGAAPDMSGALQPGQ